jgi:hypothetical protein
MLVLYFITFNHHFNEILLNLNMKCWNSTFNPQGLRIIIIVVQTRVVRICVAIVEAFKKKEKNSFHPLSPFLMVLTKVRKFH